MNLLKWFRRKIPDVFCPTTIGIVAVNGGVLMKFFLNDGQNISIALQPAAALQLSSMLEQQVIGNCAGTVPTGPIPPTWTH